MLKNIIMLTWMFEYGFKWGEMISANLIETRNEYEWDIDTR